MEWSEKEVNDYEKMLEDYDNSFIISIFKKYIPKNIDVLELGCGTGKDYLSLKNEYNILPSDFSSEFVKKMNEKYDDVAIKLDAKKIEIDRKFDCIFSNKVLNVFNDSEMKESFKNQHDKLKTNGLVFHTLWFGNEEYGQNKDYCNYINEHRLRNVIGDNFEIIHKDIYTELEENDSLVLIAKML